MVAAELAGAPAGRRLVPRSAATTTSARSAASRRASRPGTARSSTIRCEAASRTTPSGSLLHLDPPLHADYRTLLNRRFTPRAAGLLEAGRPGDGRRRARTRWRPGDEVDLVEQIAAPIPVAVIAELLGIADGDRVGLPALVRRRHRDLRPTRTTRGAGRGHGRAVRVPRRPRPRAPGDPTDDLISVLVGAEVGGRAAHARPRS